MHVSVGSCERRDTIRIPRGVSGRHINLRWTVDCSMVDGTRPATGPVRQCIGCRARAAAVELVRCAAVADHDVTTLLFDVPSKRSGRGAWLHPDRECLRLAVRRKAFAQALRQPRITIDLATMEAAFDEACALIQHR